MLIYDMKFMFGLRVDLEKIDSFSFDDEYLCVIVNTTSHWKQIKGESDKILAQLDATAIGKFLDTKRYE